MINHNGKIIPESSKELQITNRGFLYADAVFETLKYSNNHIHFWESHYFRSMSADEIFNERKNKFLKIGRGKGFMSDVEQLSSLIVKENNLKEFFNSKKNLTIFIGVSLAILISLLIFL